MREPRDQDPFLSQYQEGTIEFPMTYKLLCGKNEYKVKGKAERIPGWTDRIFFKEKASPTPTLQILNYDSQRDIMLSDHRPVIA